MHPVTAPGAPPILVIGTTRDPATPYVWAQALAKQLSSGVLLTYVGDGHTAYLRHDSVRRRGGEGLRRQPDDAEGRHYLHLTVHRAPCSR